MRHDRRWGSRLARLAVAVAVAAAAATGMAATPAHADPEGVDAFLDDVTIGADGAPGKAAPIFVTGIGVENPVLTVDVSGLAGVATADFPDRCSVAGTTATCPLPDTAEFFDMIPVVFRPAAGVTDGEEGTITYTIKADSVDPSEQTATLTVKDGADLVAFDGPEKTVKPGDRYAAPMTFANYGNQTADGVDVLLFFSWGSPLTRTRTAGTTTLWTSSPWRCATSMERSRPTVRRSTSWPVSGPRSIRTPSVRRRCPSSSSPPRKRSGCPRG
jgi:hypothetical protein